MSRTARKAAAGRSRPMEFSLIDAFVRPFGCPAAPFGPGDDAAVLPQARGAICVTTDAVVEGVHFDRRTFSLGDIGHKALAVNLSDLAAMGARPAWFVCALAAPRLTRAEATALGRGMAALASRASIPLVGGNLTRGARLSLTITAGGTLGPHGPLLRSGGRAGDRLYVSGTLGDARLGMELLRRSPRSRGEPVHRQRRPIPRLGLGELATRYAHAAIDLSDGLLQDLGHLCEASGVGARVERDDLPTSAGFRREQELGRADPGWLLAGGEEYELLLAVPGSRAASFEAAARRAGEQVTWIGNLQAARGLRLFSGGRGQRLPTRGGYDHFR